MTSHHSNSWTKPAIQVAAAGLGAAIAGPFGCALGGWLGVTLGGSAAALFEKYVDKFGESAAEKLLDLGADSLVDKIKASAPDLESLYRDALRLSLQQVHEVARCGFDDWFANWDLSLVSFMPIDLPATGPNLFGSEKLDDLFPHILEILNAQGSAIRSHNPSLNSDFPLIPSALLSELRNRLPQLFQQNFQVLVVKPEYEDGWKHVLWIFQDYVSTALGRIDEATQKIDRKTDVLPKMAEHLARLYEIAEAKPRTLRSNPLPELRENFLGREEDLRQILERVRGHRVVTITGLGGIGKSEMAKAVARASAGREWTADGVFYVDLQAASNADSARDAIISNLELDPEKPIPKQLARPCLYVLDDVYQALVGDLSAMQGFVQSLYDSAPPAHFLLTSREPIGVPGIEHPFPLGRLLPPHDANLFRSIAEGFGHNWLAGDADRTVSLLQQLDGYPLAITIAANRLRDVPLETLLRRWENRRTEALKLPGISPAELSKMTSVDFSLTLSFNRLPNGEVRALFALFADFPGGAKVDMLEALVGDELHDMLSYLTRGSLVQKQGDRYRALVPVREFASKRHTELSLRLSERLDAYLIAFAEQWCYNSAVWNTPKRLEAISVLTDEKPNLFAAVGRARVRNDDGFLARLISALGQFLPLFTNDRGESTELLRAAIAAARVVHQEQLEANCLRSLGEVYGMDDKEFESAQKCYEEALPLYQSVGDKYGEAGCIAGIGDLERQTDHPEAARIRYDQAVHLYRDQCELLGEANCLRKVAELEEDPHQKLKHFEAALALFQDIGDELGEASCLMGMAEIQLGLQNSGEAQKLLEQALPAFRKAGDKPPEGNCLMLLGNAYFMADDFENAGKYYAEARQTFSDMGNQISQGFCLASIGDMRERFLGYLNASLNRPVCVRRLGDVHMIGGNYEEAQRSYLDALPLFEDSPYPDGVLYCREKLGSLLWMKGDYTGALEQYQEATKLCNRMTIDPSEGASFLLNAGVMNVNLGQNELAWSLFERAMDLFAGNSDKPGQASCLVEMGFVLRLRRQFDQAMLKYNEALKLFEGAGPSADQALTYWGMADVCIEEGRKDDAIRRLELAAELYELADAPDQAEDLRSKVEEWRQGDITQLISPATSQARMPRFR